MKIVRTVTALCCLPLLSCSHPQSQQHGPENAEAIGYAHQHPRLDKAPSDPTDVRHRLQTDETLEAHPERNW